MEVKGKMGSTLNYRTLLKDHVKLKVIKSLPKILNENGGEILFNVKIKRIKSKIQNIEEHLSKCKVKKEQTVFEMTLRKEKAKLKTLQGG